jgi:hypothetical protein
MPCAQVLSEPGYFMRDPGMIRVAICEAGRARPAQPIDHSIGKTGMPKMTASGREHPSTLDALARTSPLR